MHQKRGLVVSLVCLAVLFAACAEICLSAGPRSTGKHAKSAAPTDRFGSSVIFPLTGNVYPDGYYHVTLDIGNPPKPYFLDIDTGSDLTWLQCDAPCTKCTPAPHSLYRPSKNLIACKDPLCASLHLSGDHRCTSAEEQCDYEVEYADQCSSLGVLVKDSFPMRFISGSIVNPRLAFGCGYNQQVPKSIKPPYTDGVLGLGSGESSIVGQMRDLGLTRNVVGHCLSKQGGGFLFFGNDLVPSSGIVWVPMLGTSIDKHYSSGPAELHFNGQTTRVKGLQIVFDSGSTYSYFNAQAYKILLSTLQRDLNRKQLKDANEETSLPVCWKGTKPFKSILDVRNLFRPFALSFANAKNVQLQLPPEAFLVVTIRGNVCLGILNGTEVELGDYNIIGDISLQDKMVIYDNEKQQIGWAPANCNSMASDFVEDFSRPYSAGLGILEEHCPADFGSWRTKKRVGK